MARRVIASTLVGLGTPNQYNLGCPTCNKINETKDAGTRGVTTRDGKSWYRFDCSCGCKYKALEVPMVIGLNKFEDLLK